MFRILFIALILSVSIAAADEPAPPTLTAPAGWGGETIKLPPGFARDMKLNGIEQIRFAPGMMKQQSDSFFCYAFVFELRKTQDLTESVLKEELLKYYRGLCKAVMGVKRGNVDHSTFTLQIEIDHDKAKPESDSPKSTRYSGILDWVEPFVTKKRQSLNLEMQTWSSGDHSYLFVCVSPQNRGSAIWKQLHAIRDDYLSHH